MTYRDAAAYLASLVDYERRPPTVPGRDFNLDRMRRLLDLAGNPHRHLRALHIAGTKGKGSTAAMTAAILTAAGFRTGLYTSPHLVDFRERIRINGEMIPRVAVARWVARIRPWLESLRDSVVGKPTFFEAYTLLAFCHFLEAKTDFVVLEVGLGGRLDATNVVTPVATAITALGLDHTNLLGDTIEQIAAEKGGVMKPGVPVVLAPHPAARAVLRRQAEERGAPVITVRRGRVSGPPSGRSVVVESLRSDARSARFHLRGLLRTYRNLRVALGGEHQAVNAAVAVALTELATRDAHPVTDHSVRCGLAMVHWPGRLQVVQRRPTVVLDAAHDALSARILARSLRGLFRWRRLILVVGMSAEKDAAAFLRALAPLADEVICTAADTPRALPPESLGALAARHRTPWRAVPRVRDAVRSAVRDAQPNDLVCVTGSVYVVGEALAALKGGATA